MSPLYVGVIVDRIHAALDKIFYYSVPISLTDQVALGMRVSVPFGTKNALITGFVIEITSELSNQEFQLKELYALLDSFPLLLPKFIPLLHWMRKEYHSSYIECIRCFVPKLSKSMKIAQIHDKDNFELIEKNNYILNTEQLLAVDKIGSAVKDAGGNFVLEGVTGSGKTEVYIKLAQIAVELDKQSIILVPEISLTPQTMARFRDRFGNSVSIFHSKMTSKDRLNHWHRLRTGESKVVVGARSAVFLPIQKLGLIVIDESHEDSYKSDMRPKYHTIDLARKRCALEGAVLVLGSATPRIEDTFLVNKTYTKIILAHRVENWNLPTVKIVDMREEILRGNRNIISQVLYSSLKKVLDKKEQAIVLINRRGYAQFVLCRSCGYVVMCQNCQVSLTVHQEDNHLKCHYCGIKKAYPIVCPKCKSKFIKNFGLGTQRVQDELIKLFNKARIVRMDLDTTSKRDSHETILDSFRSGDFDILLGTQMVAKGLDFPNVTLVGVVAADTFLNLPDYRNSEKTFQLITQVAGRAGRSDKGGEVIVQTYQPNHYSLEFASQHDYNGFYKREISLREQFGYPPFTRIIKLLFMGEDKLKLAKLSAFALGWIKDNDKYKNLDKSKVTIGSSLAPIEKINKLFRWQILIRIAPTASALDTWHDLLTELSSILPFGGERVIIDFYPVSLL